MYVKIMGPEALSDHDPRKTFTILEDVFSVEFRRHDGVASIDLIFNDGNCENIPAPGNVYVMNEHGKTIGTFVATTSETATFREVKGQ